MSLKLEQWGPVLFPLLNMEDGILPFSGDFFFSLQTFKLSFLCWNSAGPSVLAAVPTTPKPYPFLMAVL